MESEWAMIHAAIAEAAAQNFGCKVTGESRGGNPKPGGGHQRCRVPSS